MATWKDTYYNGITNPSPRFPFISLGENRPQQPGNPEPDLLVDPLLHQETIAFHPIELHLKLGHTLNEPTINASIFLQMAQYGIFCL